MAASEYRLSSPRKHRIFYRMMNNITFFIFTICIFNIIFMKNASGSPYEVKKEQWGVNQERLKVVQREENESSNEAESPETATVVKTFSGEPLQLQPCNCGKCAQCELKSLLLKYKSNGERRRFYEVSNVFNANPHESVLGGPNRFQPGLNQPVNPFLNYGYEQRPNLGYDFNPYQGYENNPYQGYENNPYQGYENNPYNPGYEVDRDLFYPPTGQYSGGYPSYNYNPFLAY